MTEEQVLKLKNAENEIFTVCIRNKYHEIGMVAWHQVAEAAKFVRDKWKTEPLFYYECGYGWLFDPQDNRYDIVDERSAS